MLSLAFYIFLTKFWVSNSFFENTIVAFHSSVFSNNRSSLIKICKPDEVTALSIIYRGKYLLTYLIKLLFPLVHVSVVFDYIVLPHIWQVKLTIIVVPLLKHNFLTHLKLDHLQIYILCEITAQLVQHLLHIDTHSSALSFKSCLIYLKLTFQLLLEHWQHSWTAFKNIIWCTFPFRTINCNWI